MRRALLVVSLNVATAVAVLHAPGARCEDAVPKGVVLVTIAAADDIAGPLSGSLNELLDRLPVQPTIGRVDAVDPATVVIPPKTFTPAVARVWIDLRGDVGRVYLADGAWERVLVRTVPLPNGPDEVAREQIAHIVAGSIEALLSGAKIGVGREDAATTLGVPTPPTKTTETTETKPPPARAPSPPVVVAPPVSRAPIGWAVGLAYEVSTFAPGALGHTVSGWVKARASDARTTAFAAVGLGARAPLVFEQDPLGVRLETAGARAMFGVASRVTPGLELRAAVGGGVDIVQITPRATARGAIAEDRRSTWSPIARAALSIDARLSSSAWVSLALATEVELDPREYVVLSGATSQTVVSPYVVRPALQLSLFADLR